MAFCIARVSLQAGLLSLALAAGGCTGLIHSNRPATHTWLLQPYVPSAVRRAGEPARVNLSVSAVPGLDSERILTFSSDSELNHFAAARWPDNLPEMTASLVARTLHSSGRFEVVNVGGGEAAADCDLHVLIEKFYAVTGPSGRPSAVRVAMNGRYACRGSGSGNFELDSNAAVGEMRLPAIVAAFQRAVDDVLAQLLQALESRSQGTKSG